MASSHSDTSHMRAKVVIIITTKRIKTTCINIYIAISFEIIIISKAKQKIKSVKAKRFIVITQ